MMFREPGWKFISFFAVFMIVGGAFSALADVETPHADDRVLIVTRDDCARLVVHRSAPDVDYRPGVDVYGRAVVPADLGKDAFSKDGVLPDTVEILITVELAERFGLPPTSDLYKGEAMIGAARVRLRDGRAWFNGQALSSDEQASLARLCQEVMRRENP